MQEYDDRLIEPLAVDGVVVPLLRLNDIELPSVSLKVGDTEYMYERSVPIKGHGAILPRYLSTILSDGRKPLIVERIERYYVYLAHQEQAPPEPAAAEPAADSGEAASEEVESAAEPETAPAT